MRSLAEVAQTHSRNLGRKFFWRALPTLLLLSLVGLVLSKANLLERSFESIRQQLLHAISVGDGFQIQRILGSEVSSGSIVGAKVYILDSQNTEFIAGLSNLQNSFEIRGGSIVLSKNFPADSAVVTFSAAIPLYYFGVVLLIVSALSLMFRLLVNAALTRFAFALTAPLQGLALAVKENSSKDSSGVKEISEVFEQIRHSQDIERANQELILNAKRSRELVTLSRRVAHDIRSPLSAIRVGVSVLEKGSSTEASGIVKSAVSRMDSIAAELLNTSKNADDVFDLNTILTELAESFSFQGSAVSYHGESEIYVSGNPVSVSRAFANLIQNAIEACKETAGRVSITASCIGTRAIVEVTDSGIGMSPEVLAELGRVSGFSYSKANGNGLGFSSAQAVIKSLGGEVRMQSEYGVGTSLRISLPVLSATAKTSASTELHNL